VVLAIFLLLDGAVILTVGAESAITGAARVAHAMNISPFVLGALLFGVDFEAVAAVLIATGQGQTALAAGEAFGTVVFLFSAAFGVALLLAPRPVEAPSRGMILLPALSLVAGAITVSDTVVGRFEGGALVLVYVVYLSAVVQEGRSAAKRAERIEQEAAGSRLPPTVLLFGGLALVFGGAEMLVQGGIGILERTALSAGFVGAALIGALVSADEVLLEIIPIRRGVPELATGNLFGSVAAFTSGLLGLAAMVRPLVLDSAAESAFLAMALLYTMVAVPFLARGRAGKATGILVLVVYAAWLALASGF